MHSIVIVRGEDWEGLYYNGILAMEGHSISLIEALTYVSDLSTFEVDYIEADIAWLYERGSLPVSLEEVQYYVN